MIVVATLAGIVCGVVLSVIPGLHLALVFSVVFGLLGTGISTACFIGSAVGVAIYLKRLGSVYHPNASTDVASLDPALRLTAEGKGPLALAIMKEATDRAFVPVGLCVFILFVGLAIGINTAMTFNKLLAPVGCILIVAWLGYTSYRSKNPWPTFFTMLSIGLFGYVVFNHPGMTGSPHQMAPVMSGLFGIPIMLAVFQERKKHGLPPQERNFKFTPNSEAAKAGAAIGCATGFLAGLGTQSLVSLAIQKEDSNEDVLMLTSAGEASNDLMALVLALAASMGRSGEAALLSRALPEIEFFAALTVAGAILLGAWVGREALNKFEAPYIKLVTAVPSGVWAVLVLSLAIGQVLLHHNALLALALTGSGILLSSWARSNEMPLQVSFAALALPILIQAAGLVPFMNSVLF